MLSKHLFFQVTLKTFAFCLVGLGLYFVWKIFLIKNTRSTAKVVLMLDFFRVESLLTITHSLVDWYYSQERVEWNRIIRFYCQFEEKAGFS